MTSLDSPASTGGQRFRPPRPAIVGGVAALLCLVQLGCDVFAAGRMAETFTRWCVTDGFGETEYSLDCAHTGAFLDATTRLHPLVLTMAAAAAITAVLLWRRGWTARIVGTATAGVGVALAGAALLYYPALARRIARAAVLGIPEVVPGWYPTAMITLDVVVALIGVGVAVAAWRAPRRTDTG